MKTFNVKLAEYIKQRGLTKKKFSVYKLAFN